METYRFDFKDNEPVKVVFVGDIHLGVKGCNEDKLRMLFDKIAHMPNVYMVGMGDYGEYREPSNDKYDYEISTYSIEEQLDIIFGLFDSVKDKILGLLIGNHEYGLIRKTSDNPIKRWCKSSDVAYFAHMALMRLKFPNAEEYSFIVAHGHGGGRKAGSKVNALTDFISEHDVDCVVMGHNHSLFEWVKTELIYPEGNIESRYKSCGFSGTFYRTYQTGSSGYQERKMYSPTPMGFLCANINPRPDRLNRGFDLPSPTRGLELNTVII